MIENRVGAGSGNGCNTRRDTSIIRLQIQGGDKLVPLSKDSNDGHIPSYPAMGAHIAAGSDSMTFHTTATIYRVVIEMGSWDSVQGDPNSFVQRRYTHDNATDGCTSKRYRYLDFTVTDQDPGLLKLRVRPTGNQYEVVVLSGTATLSRTDVQKTTTDFSQKGEPYTPVNEQPVLRDQQFSVAENSAVGTVVGTVVATDPEGGPLTYRVTGGTGQGVFALNSSGQITVANSSRLDYEAEPRFTLQVQVSDQGPPPLSASATITINLTNVNEDSVPPPPPFGLRVH